jgi:hypothetical protein
MEGESLSRLSTDPRQPGELGDQLLDGTHRSERRGEWKRLHLSHLGLEEIGRPALRFGHRTEDQIAQKLGIVPTEHGGVDDHRPHGSPPIGSDAHHAATGGRLDGPPRQFGLQLLKPALYLLAELKELLKVCHAFG